MTTIRVAQTTVLLAGFALAASAVAQQPAAAPAPAKPVAPAAAKPMAAPAAAPAAAKPAAAAPAAPAAAAPAAAPPAAPPMPAPSKELEAFWKGAEGSWKCDTKFPAGAMGPGSPEMTAKSTVKIKKDYGGMAWHGEYNLPKSKTMPALTGIFQVSWEPGTNQASIVGYDNMGSVSMGVGPIVGDSITFAEEGYMMGMKVKMRETMFKKSPKEIGHKYEVDMGKGFQPMGEDACKK